MYLLNKKHILSEADVSMKFSYLTLLGAFLKEMKEDKIDIFIDAISFPKELEIVLKNSIKKINKEDIISARDELIDNKYNHLFLTELFLLYFELGSEKEEILNVIDEFVTVLKVDNDIKNEIHTMIMRLYKKDYEYLEFNFKDNEWISEEDFNYIYYIFNLENVKNEEFQKIVSEKKNKWVKIKKIKKITDDPKLIENYKYTVFNTQELNELEDKEIEEWGTFSSKTVYLLGDKFEIRAKEFERNNITYVGINKPTVNLVGIKSEDIMINSFDIVEGLLFDARTSWIKFRNIYLTSKQDMYLDVDKGEETISECTVDKSKVKVIDSGEETAEFLDMAIPEFQKRGWL